MKLKTLTALVFLQLIAIPASAQFIGTQKAKRLQSSPQGAFNKQPIATNGGDLSVFFGPLASPKFGSDVGAGISVFHVPELAIGDLVITEQQFYAGLQAGLAYGIVGGLEAGLFTPFIPLSADQEISGLPLFLTWATSVDAADYGVRVTVSPPVGGQANLELNPGLHVLLRGDRSRFDLGAFFPMEFADDAIVGLRVPARLSIRVVEGFFLGLESGVSKTDMVNGERDIYIPLGVHALYSLALGDHRVDISARMQWDSFFWVNGGEFADPIVADLYQIGLGANFLFDIAGN